MYACVYCLCNAHRQHNSQTRSTKDGFIAFKSKQMAKTLEVVLRPHIDIDLNPVWDDLTY